MVAGQFVPTPEELYYAHRELPRWSFPIVIVFWTCLWCVKASFLSLFYRIIKPWTILRRCWYFVVFLTVGSYIGAIMTNIFTCKSLHDFFNGTLFSLNPHVAIGACGLVADICFYCRWL